MSYKKNCNRCNQQILMDESLAKWKALNLDGTAHICSEKDSKNEISEQQTQQPQTEQTTAKTVWSVLEEYNRRIQKLEAKVFSKEGTN